ncbi:DMT family transporter [uncultured Eudoraea sp.]|uniref:DMT family transporter n=1 Tax=uncultured Eudoraea sp. TaxID=1035614 RepID=UPI0026120058|nr:DMT family transporter [uncultured Eudoraea sp.]
MDLKKAIYFMLLSTLAFTLMNGLLKFLTSYSAYQMVFFRSLGSLFFTFGFLLNRGIPVLGTHRKLLILRGLVGSTSMVLFFMALHYMPLGSAVGLRYIAPIFAAIFAILLLREKVKPIQWLFFIISFLGVLVLKGLDRNVPLIGLALVLIASVFSGLVYIIIRKIGSREHPVVIVNYFMCIATIIGGVGAIFNWKTPVGIDWFLLSSLGVFGYFGQLFMTKAFQMGETNAIAPLKYLEVFFAVIVGVIFLVEEYVIWSFVGMAMIIGGLLLNIWFKQRLLKK